MKKAGMAVALATAAIVVAAAALVADGAYQDCYNYCFNDCVSKDKSMRDYCSYACDKTCAPDDAALHLQRRPIAINCQLACARDSCRTRRPADDDDMKACYGQCYDRCDTTRAGLPRPLRAGGGGGGGGGGLVRPAALPDHPFHKKPDMVRPAALPDHPFHKKEDSVRPAALPNHPFHKKQDAAVWPAALPDHPFHKTHDAVKPEGDPVRP